jgi:xanthine/CO dehydrogenase XdhC/CoxF family maturation factor
MVEIQAIVRILSASTAPGAALATLVNVDGSSYRRPGARLLLTPNGDRIGSISGGCLEEDLIARAQRVATSGVAELVTYDTSSENDLIWGVGLGCHGVVQILVEKLPAAPRWVAAVAANFRSHRPTRLAVVWRSGDASILGTYLANELPDVTTAAEIFLEHLQPPVRLLVFGAGDDARPLVRLAKELGWHVTVGDPRADFATKTRFPTADALVVAPAAELVRLTDPPADALAVIMTHHYVHDVPLLRELLPRLLPYIGLLGPKKRAAQIVSDIQRQGYALSSSQRERLHAPVGLDLGAETPEEVALSIIAEMRATLAQRDGRPLRQRERPIHEVFAPQKPNLSSERDGTKIDGTR